VVSLPERRRDFFDEMRDMIEAAIAQAFRQAGVQYIPSQPHGDHAGEPYAEVIDSGAEYVITSELPGVRVEDVRINAAENALEILVKGSQGHASRYRGSKTYALPCGINPGKINAKYRNGVLEVKAPKRNPKKRRNKEV
jgi:HSP20 family molecular chaperone IbpA